MTRPRIVQHSFGSPGSGGPIGALNRILNSDLTNTFEFRHVAQPRPAGGINLGLVREMSRQMREFRPDLAHVRGLGNEGFHGVLAARMAGVPRILVSVHGSVGDLVYGAGGLRQQIVFRGLEPLTLRMASHVSTVCEDALRKPILRPVAQKIIGVVPNGVDPVTASASDRAASRRSLAIGDDDIVLIIVARLVRDKGHLDLLQALMTIESGPLDADAKVHLVVVGDGPDSAEISRQARLLTRFHVHLLGRRHDVAALLAAADIAVMPSWHENMSNALLEAMAAGLPVVVTSVGGNTEVLAQGGGLLVPPSDERALAEAIRRLLVDVALREALGVEARTVFESRYTTGHMTTRLSEIYNLILES